VTFRIPCPNCGPRPVEEFTTTGETRERPTGSPSRRELSHYVYFRRNVRGVQSEWWYHRFGCELWFLAERDTRDNRVVETRLPASSRSEW
jgi:sarcosine oxidase subunit delta